MANADITEVERSELRAAAAARSQALVQQLESDQADLVDWNNRQNKVNADATIAMGIDAAARVIEAARRVQSKLQGG